MKMENWILRITDVLLDILAYKSTETTGAPNTDWTSSVLDITTNEETSVYNMYSSSWYGTDSLFSSTIRL